MDILRFFEPEEVVGNLWHGLARRWSSEPPGDEAAVHLETVRPTLALVFRALGGAHDVEVVEAAAERVSHRRRLRRRLSHGVERASRPVYDGERLRLPAAISSFEDAELNKTAYLWLTATAALGQYPEEGYPPPGAAPGERDHAYLQLNLVAAQPVLDACPGLRTAYTAMCHATLAQRASTGAGASALEHRVREHLAGHAVDADTLPNMQQASRIVPVPFWLELRPSSSEGFAAREAEDNAGRPPAGAAGATKRGQRRHFEQANRKDSFIIHRFESILSLTESMDINRSVEDDDDDNAKKAADDQDSVTLSRHDKKSASRLHLHLDLSPAEAEHERLAGKFTYPEWNHRRQHYMVDHCCVLEAEATVPEHVDFVLNQRDAERVRRQFEALRTRRIMQTRQTDGTELDLDALITARADLLATGRGSDRIYTASRKSQRDLSVALLLDASRSTEADLGGSCVIDVSRHALNAIAHGLDACGDRFGIWSFSSLRRSRVFVNTCKGFDEPMSHRVNERIAALKPGHYTRLGAAIRHISGRLADEPSAQKLLLVLTDGKPNDIDHYEGQHGVEDSRMAVREARRQGLVVHGVVIDEDGQDWFARIFERKGFTLLPRPEKLMTTLPEIYRSLTQEF